MRSLLLVILDFPRYKRQSRSLEKQNKELQKKYKVTGFPTFFLTRGEDEKIIPIARQYDQDKFIVALRQAQKKIKTSKDDDKSEAKK